jgi:hypothetical protein
VLAVTTVDLTCTACTLTLADHVIGGEPEEMEALGFHAATFEAFQVPQSVWCLHGLGGHQEFFAPPGLRIIDGGALTLG